ncbi:hypothetical protein [Streptomyces sp. NPDC101149]|uniref:hypothetical protein n=1 Tax=Streptomyces sp. NPDC101149 TaxID=3366113 RepID=UPI00380EB193
MSPAGISPDARAVVRALVDLTTQVRRLADARQSDFVLTPDAADDVPPTAVVDDRQPAYAAVYAYIRRLGDVMPTSRIDRNAIIWHAVNAALDVGPVAPATTCSARYARTGTSQMRWCIRAADHDEHHTDSGGFHWDDSHAVYPVADGRVKEWIPPVVTVHGDPDMGPAAREALDALAAVAVRGMTKAPADDDQALRWARREPLLVLLARLQRGRILSEDEARTLRQHVEAEMDEADTARKRAEQAEQRLGRIRDMADAWERCLPATIRTATAAEAVRLAAVGDDHPVMFGMQPDTELRVELEQARAAIERVRAIVAGIAHPTSAGIRDYDVGRYEMAAAVVAALVVTEQPTTEAPPLRVEPCTTPRMAIHCGGQCLAIASSDPDRDRTDRIALVGDTLTCFTGTPGDRPPSIEPGAHLIADVYVPRGTTAITAANITSSGLLFYRPTTKEN